MRTAFVLLLMMLMLASPQAGATEAAASLMALAQDQARRQEWDGAMTTIKAALQRSPANIDVLRLADAIAASSNRDKELAEWLEGLSTSGSERDRFFIRQSQLMAYSRARQPEDIERVRSEILELRNNSTSPQFKALKRFIRETVYLGQSRSVISDESFELAGPTAVRYTFTLVQPQMSPRRVSLGSYDITTNMAREARGLSADWRMWHLDAYDPDGTHFTLGMYDDGEPSYEKARQLAMDWFRGNLKAMSSSRVQRPQ